MGMTSNAAPSDWPVDQSDPIPPDPWSADWTLPPQDDLESRHESVRRHQREGRIPSRQVNQASRRANRRFSSKGDRRADAQGDRRADPEGDRRADAQGDRRANSSADQEWIGTFWRDREDGPAHSA